MSINQGDVKLYESERLIDTDDGGGRATGIEVIDNDVNNLFPDISRMDRTIGDVSLRKTFVGINTNNADTWLGSHAIITKVPVDPNVHVVIFEATSENDERVDAQNRIESYVVKGARAKFELLGDQFTNQRQLVVVQRQEVEIPSVGDVYLLDNGSDEQYVRVTEVESQITTFAYLQGSTFVDFQRRRIVLSISAPLSHNFEGGEVTPAGTTSPKSDVFTTQVADAARYYGSKLSAKDVNIGDLLVEVESVYAALVPSAQSEAPLIDQGLGFDRLDIRAGAGADYSEALTGQYTSGTNIQVFINRAAVRGTLQLTLGGSDYLDDGSGTLTRTSGAFPFSELTIDYDSGAIFGTRDSGTGTGTVAGSATYRPGAPFIGRAVSSKTEITLNNRGFNFIEPFPETKPRPGTMVISYMVLGEWFEIRDPGNGVLEGDGVGSIDFTTGTVAVTLLALPDVETPIIYSFIMDVEEEVEQHDGVVADAIPAVELALAGAVVPFTVTITFTSGGVLQTVTDDGSGNLSGDGTGTIIYASGEVELYPTTLHDDGTDFDVNYQAGTQKTHSNTGSGTITGTLPDAPIMPGSIDGWVKTNLFTANIQDDGAGNINGAASGTINYATGAYSITRNEIQVNTFTEYYEVRVSGGSSGTSFERKKRTVTRNIQILAEQISVFYREDGDPASAQALNGFSPNELVLSPITGTDDAIIEDSLLFEFAGETYFDRNGIIYKGFDSKTGAGTAVGSVNYGDRKIILDTWLGGSAQGVTLLSALTQGRTSLVSSIMFRTPGAPLRPESVSITATDIDGNIISDTANADGEFSTPSLTGSVNYETGVIDLRFTTDPGDDLGDFSVPVFPTATYNAVVLSFLPLDADLIGIDPVRLPSDGRVPIYRPGDVLVLQHTTETDIGIPTAGQVVALPRDHQAYIDVIDANSKAMDPAQYTIDLAAGEVTFADPLVLQDAGTDPLTTPLTVRDRIEHMAVINDVQITGEVSFTTPVAHHYPAGETVVSSAVVWGDIFSRVFNLFTQKTWDSGDPNWTDDRIGDDTTSNYNDVDYPIQYTNNGAITEKWAMRFISSTSFQIIGESLGIIGTGNISTTTAPINPNTGNPYFVIPAEGWGAGWSTNNVLRFNTWGALAPLWAARTVISGQAIADNDKFTMALRGDAD